MAGNILPFKCVICGSEGQPQSFKKCPNCDRIVGVECWQPKFQKVPEDDPDMVDSCQGENNFPPLFMKRIISVIAPGHNQRRDLSATIDHSDIRGFDRMTCLHRGAVSL
jgi:hypothetical protein